MANYLSTCNFGLFVAKILKLVLVALLSFVVDRSRSSLWFGGSILSLCFGYESLVATCRTLWRLVALLYVLSTAIFRLYFACLVFRLVRSTSLLCSALRQFLHGLECPSSKLLQNFAHRYICLTHIDTLSVCILGMSCVEMLYFKCDCNDNHSLYNDNKITFFLIL